MRFISDFKTELTKQLEKVKNKIIIITGYVTVEGFDFAESFLVGKEIEKIIIFKLNLYDFKNGACSFNFKNAVDRGWNVYINKTIHAKNYIFDDEVIIQGSSNLTSNGIGLNHNRKDDNNAIWDYNHDFQCWVENKIRSSISINTQNANETDMYIEKVMGEIDLQTISLKQQKLDDRLVKAQLFITPSTIVSSEDGIILSKVINSFIKTFKNNPLAFSYEITDSDLDKEYKYFENIEWFSKYIIDVNHSLNYEFFNCNNSLYRYTPKIYKFNGKYYLEKLYGNSINANNEDSIVLLLFVLKDMFKFGMATNNIFSHVLINRNTIKFDKFHPIKASDRDELEILYKSSLLERCNTENIKALIQDFHLEEI